MVLGLSAVKDDHFGNELLLVRLEAGKDGADVVGGSGGLIGTEKLQKAETSLPPLRWYGVVGYELVICRFGGLEDAVGFVGLGKGFAGRGGGFQFVDDGIKVEGD